MNSKNITIRYILPIMLIVTVKLLCNALFMNKIGFHLFNHYIVLTQSALLYSLLFALLDLSTIIYGLRTTYIIVILGAVMDGIYSLGVYSTTLFAIPYIEGHSFPNTNAIHQLALPTIELYLGGVIGSTVTYFAEIFIFNYFYKKWCKNRFSIASTLSVAITILIHNTILYPLIIEDKTLVWNIYWSNFLVNIIFIIVYTRIASYIYNNFYKNPKENAYEA